MEEEIEKLDIVSTTYIPEEGNEDELEGERIDE